MNDVSDRLKLFPSLKRERRSAAPFAHASGSEREIWPVAIIGAGPAGAFLAYRLAMAGVRVLVIDRATFPRWKVCGCCLNQPALSILERAGLRHLLRERQAVPLSQTRLSAAGRSATLKLPGGAALSRRSFDLGLIEAATAQGAVFLPGTSAHLQSDINREMRFLRLNQEEKPISARIVIVANGLGGSFLAHEPGHRIRVSRTSHIGAGATIEDASPFFALGTIYMACATPGYVGLVRLEDGTLDLATALDPESVRRRGLPSIVAEILSQTDWPRLSSLDNLPWRGTPSLSRQALIPAGQRYFVVGDAAGYVEPFTGEGIAWALAGAEALTPIVLDAVKHWHPALIHLWSDRLRELLGPRRLTCRLLTTLLRSPRLTAVMVRLLAMLPALARPVVALLNRPFALQRSTS